MTKLRFALVLFSLLTGRIVFAQPALAWGQRYNGPPDYGDEAHDVAVDNSGNVYVTGSAFSANGTLDMVTIKYSPSGQQLWLQSYNGGANDNDESFEIVLSDSGNVYVVGYSKNSASMQDITTVKYSAGGVQQWAKTYNGAFSNYDVGNGIAVDAAGNVYVTGVETTSNYTYDFATIKYSAGGAELWVQTYNGVGNFNDEALDIALDANNDVYVVGSTDTMYNSQPNEDMILLKYSNSGSLQWRRVYDSPGHAYEWGQRLAIDRNNNIYYTGYGWVTGNGNDIYVVKYNAAGNFQWLRNYNYAAGLFERPSAIACDSLGNVIVTGQGIQPTNNNFNDYVTVKYNGAGTFQWAERYDFGDDDRAYAIDVDDSLGIIVTGYSKVSGNDLDIATVRYDAGGNEKWVVRYNNTGVSNGDIGNAVVAKNGDVYVAGISGNLTNNDYITLRYSYSAVGIEEQTRSLPLAVFPNPSGGEVRLMVPSSNEKSAGYSVIVTDALGQPVELPAFPAESTGDQDVLLLNTSGLAPGIYLVRVFRGNEEAGSARIVVK